MSNNRIQIEVSPGELWDKITILRHKAARMTDNAKLFNVRTELELLEAIATRSMEISAELRFAIEALAEVNAQLWEIEDAIRGCEARADFAAEFVLLARSVYRTNDHRSELKRQINQLTGATIAEEKQYTRYQ